MQRSKGKSKKNVESSEDSDLTDIEEIELSEGEDIYEDEEVLSVEDIKSDNEEDEDIIDKEAFRRDYNKKKEQKKSNIRSKKEDFDDDESEGEKMLKKKKPPSRFGDVSGNYVSKLDNPYVKTELAKTVTLKPREQTSDIVINLKKSLINDLTGKIFRDYGFIKKIYKLISYETGRIKPEDFSGDVIFDVKFYAKICKPEQGDVISAQIDSIGEKFIRCSNGPMNIFISYKFVDYDVFSEDSSTKKGGLIFNKSGKNLQINDYVKIRILKMDLQPQNTSIIIIGHLMDFIK